MSPLQQAFILTSAALMLGVGMIVGAISLRPDQHLQIVTSPGTTMTGDDMGVSGKGYENEDLASSPRS